jgi:thiol:disulfide interchange protein DsbA
MKISAIKRLLWLVMLLPTLVLARDYTAGKDYIELPAPIATQTGDKVEVLEFFWYGCPHCFQFDPKLEKWLKTLPANAQFMRVPAPLNPNWMVHTKTYYALESMGKGEQYHHDLFNALHVERKKIFTVEAVADFLAEKGVDKKAFMDAYGSFAVEMRARKTTQLGQSYRLNGVPMLTVNGKYVITAEKAGGFDGMLEVASYLIQKETKAAK